MNHYENLTEAMAEVSDQYLQEAATARKKKFPWFGAVAASLAAVMLLVLLSPLVLVAMFFGGGGTASADPGAVPGGMLDSTDTPMQHWLEQLHLSTGQLSAPEYPKMAPYPQDPNGQTETPAYRAWSTALKSQYDQPEGYADGLVEFFSRSIPLFLGDSDENAVCSPLNIYMALAMLAETTGGDSRSNLLEVLNADSMEALRTQAGHVWNAHYRTDGASACLLANSLWLSEDYTYNPDTVATLSDSYYAWVYRAAMGSENMNNALRAWLSVQTQGLLDEYIGNIELSDEDALALASTVYFQAKWESPFRSRQNTVGAFHSPSGDKEVIFMNDELTYGPYYYGEDFGAVRLGLDPAGVYGDASVWLILPDEGYDPTDLLESGHAMNMVLGLTEQNQTTIKVHLSLPKFDISAETDLRGGMTALGLGDLFSETAADFSGILPQTQGAHLDKVSHAARVAIDEEGVTAAAYTVIRLYGAPVPPEEEVYFTLDRPFLFVITSPDNLPLFVGVVNEP